MNHERSWGVNRQIRGYVFAVQRCWDVWTLQCRRRKCRRCLPTWSEPHLIAGRNADKDPHPRHKMSDEIVDGSIYDIIIYVPENLEPIRRVCRNDRSADLRHLDNASNPIDIEQLVLYDSHFNTS